MTKNLVFAALLGCLLIAPDSSLAMTISVYDWNTQQAEINNWIDGLGGVTNVVEDFEGLTPGWYQQLDTSIGQISINQDTKAGTGTSSYGHKEGGDGAFFELRSYDANGRFNTSAGGSNYVDSADITSFSLGLTEDITNLFFLVTDPSDIGAKTSTGSGNGISFFNPRLKDASRWFVGIDSGTDFISEILWSTNGFTSDGFGLDDFSTVSAPVPEPSTLFLLCAGLMGMGLARRRMRK